MVRDPRKSRARRSAKSFTTHNGNTVKIRRGFKERHQAAKEAKARKKAIARASLPNNFFLRQVHRLHPRRMAAYWFSRDGVIMALKIVGITVVICFVLLVGLFAYFRKDLPKINSLAGDKLGGSISYYDSTGKVLLWQDYGAVKRVPVKGDQMSQYMRNATVAIEDQHFYSEGAFNLKGIARAALHDIFGIGSSDGLQGGSTITQQLVKLNEQWTDNRTIGRKIKELILAIDLNRQYSKSEILTGYLNIAPYGGVEYGCESAAEDYFHTSCQDLTLAQSAFLAAIPQAPTYYSPYSDPKWNPAATTDLFDQQALLNRKNYVLDQMVKLKMITSAQATAAKQVDVLSQIQPLTAKFNDIKAPYFVLAAKQELDQKYGPATVNRGGWKVITSLNLNIQNKAEQIVQQNLRQVEREGGNEEAMVIEDVPTGQVVGLVGGVDFNNPDHGKINFASNAQLQPGSSIKPYVYATLINNSNAGAGSVFYDSQGPIIDKSTGEGYPCTIKTPPNAEGGGPGNCLWDDNRTYPGPETIRYALGGSRNVPAVKAFIQAGITRTQKTMTEMMNPNYNNGYLYNCYSDTALSKVVPCSPAAGIGSGAYLTLANQANGLASFSRMGKSIPQTYILKITNASGQVVDQYKQSQGKQVIDPQTAYIINNILSDPRATYFPYGFKIQNWHGWDFAIKTGTTNNNSDFYLDGYSTQYSVVSWAGSANTNTILTGSSDTTTYDMTAPMLEYLHEGKTPVNWTPPKGIQTLPAYVMYSGKGEMFGAEFPSPRTDLYPSWYKPKAGSGGSVTIDKVSNKLATQCTPALAQEVITNGNANGFSVDQFYGNGTSGTYYNASAPDDIHNCNDTKPYFQNNTISVTDNATGQPTTTCSSTDGCTISVTPEQGTYPLNSTSFPGEVIIKINGNTVVDTKSITANTPVTYSWTPTANGSATISAEIIDSVLYSATINTLPISTTNTPSTPPPTNSGGGNGQQGGGNGGNGGGNGGKP